MHGAFLNILIQITCYLRNISSETVSLFLPLALLRASTLRPLAEDILSLKPCLLRLFVFDGWYVLFI
jgi:hypothetical protein